MLAETFGDGAGDFVTLCHQGNIEKPEPVRDSGFQSESEVRRNSETVEVAARAGVEPATNWLTANCSTTELPGIAHKTLPNTRKLGTGKGFLGKNGGGAESFDVRRSFARSWEAK